MDKEKIKFLKNANNFELITEGHGGAEKYLFEKDGKKYFIKAGKIDYFENLEEILTKADVPHPKIVETGTIDKNNKYIIEEFVDGTPLKQLLSNLQPKFVYEYGFKLGEKFRNLQKDFPNKKVDNKAYTQFCQDVDKAIKSLKKQIKNEHNNLSPNELNFFAWMENFLLSNKQLIKNSIMVFGHNDIKPSNFLVNGNKIYAIDIEGIKYKELSWSLVWSLSRTDFKDEKNHTFLEGWLDGLFNFKVPKCVLDCCNYTYLFNMCINFEKLIKKRSFEKVIKLMEHIKNNYIVGSRIVLNKRLIKVAKISDFKNLKGFNFNLVAGSYTPTNLVFKCTKGDKKYFLKIMQLDETKFECVIKGYQTLNNCQVSTPRVVEYGRCKSSNRYYVLFEFLDYPEFQLTYTTFEDGVKFGKLAAEHLKYLRNATDNNFGTLTKADLFDAYTKVIDAIFDRVGVSTIFKCSKTEMQNFLKVFLQSFDEEKINLIRYDLKIGNILFNGQNMIFVDNEDLINSYETINFRYLITSCFWGKHMAQSQGFVKGYLNYIYKGKLPKRVQNQIKLLLLSRVLDKFENKKDCQDVDNYIINFERYIKNGEEIEWLK